MIKAIVLAAMIGGFTLSGGASAVSAAPAAPVQADQVEGAGDPCP